MLCSNYNYFCYYHFCLNKETLLYVFLFTASQKSSFPFSAWCVWHDIALIDSASWNRQAAAQPF